MDAPAVTKKNFPITAIPWTNSGQGGCVGEKCQKPEPKIFVKQHSAIRIAPEDYIIDGVLSVDVRDAGG